MKKRSHKDQPIRAMGAPISAYLASNDTAKEPNMPTNTQKQGHTPGPWYRNIRANGKYPVVFAGRNQHVATVSQQKDGSETEANIDLIAAAPELLDALKHVVEVFDAPGVVLPDEEPLFEALAKCRSIIRNVEGR